MRIIKKSKNPPPKVSLILLDWTVRESFHLCHYLEKQTVPRDQFEVVLIEYYSGVSTAAEKFEDQIDTWALLEMEEDTYYHKHMMYNIGFLLSRGDIIVICDSDAMVKPTFVESIIKHFEENPKTVLHLDQFRNHRRDLYPFNYPSFEEVISVGCINNAEGITVGVAATDDLIHKRNYGTCFCCKRKDFLDIGGADEHIDYVGHICGPYDLTFRFINHGLKEIWHQKEFLYHTWHPGSDGVDNYLGPHDGYNMSTNSLEAIFTGRTFPHVINPLIKKAKEGKEILEKEILNDSISPQNLLITKNAFLGEKENTTRWSRETRLDILVRSYVIRKNGALFEAYPLSTLRGINETKSVKPKYSHSHFQKVKRYVYSQTHYEAFKNWFSISIRLVKKYFTLIFQKAKHFLFMALEGKKKVNRRLSHINAIAKMDSFPWNTYKHLSDQSEILVLVNSQRDLYIYQEIIRTQEALFHSITKLIQKERKPTKVKLIDKTFFENPPPSTSFFVTPSLHQEFKEIVKEKKISMTII